MNHHTDQDRKAILDQGVDPSAVQGRERPIRCGICRRPTLHLAGYCELHYEPPKLGTGYPKASVSLIR